MTSWYVVSVGYTRVEAADAPAAVASVAANPRQGIGRDLVVKTEAEAKAICAMVVPHVGVSANGSVSVTMNAKKARA